MADFPLDSQDATPENFSSVAVGDRIYFLSTVSKEYELGTVKGLWPAEGNYPARVQVERPKGINPMTKKTRAGGFVWMMFEKTCRLYTPGTAAISAASQAPSTELVDQLQASIEAVTASNEEAPADGDSQV